MTDKLEQISAMADEQWDDKAIDALLADPELQAQWSQHHRVKDALQGEDVTLASVDFADRVASAIASEPTLLAPKATTQTKSNAGPAKVVQLFRQFGQYAIAAGVAAVAILGVQQLGQEQIEQSPLPVLNTNPVVGAAAAPVSLSAPTPVQPSAISQHQAREILIEQRRRINAYFQDHELQQRIQQPVELEPDTDQTQPKPYSEH